MLFIEGKLKGTLSEGQFNEDEELEGYGQSIGLDGYHYIGEWKGSNRHGQGKCTYANGKIEEGEWVNHKF